MMRIQWCVDLPDPNYPHTTWVEAGVFDRRKDAVDFVVNAYGLPRKAARYFISRVEM